MGNIKKYLAFIEPLEDIANKQEVMCNIRIITGERAYDVLHQKLTTDIFRYYFWGTTLEVISIDSSTGQVVSVEDLQMETMSMFNIGITYALTYNRMNHDILCFNGMLYNLDESLFARHCKPVLQNIYNVIDTSYNFSMRIHTLKGALLNILFDNNINPNAAGYKYALGCGFVAANKQTLRNMIPQTQKV